MRSTSVTEVAKPRSLIADRSVWFSLQLSIEKPECVIESSENRCLLSECCNCGGEQRHKSENQYLTPECHCYGRR